MSRTNALYALIAFALGATTVLVAETKVTFDPKAFYVGAEPKAAAAALLKEAVVLAKNDSRERIGIGRVSYLSGDTKNGDAVFESVLGGKADKGDLYRVATAYAVAKNWSKAKPLFERAIAMDADDDSGILKAACWFNLNGERERAEELFGRAFGKNDDHAWHYILSAGSYVGVAPF